MKEITVMSVTPIKRKSTERTAARRSFMVYNVRNHPERFEEHIRDIVNDTRAAALRALGDGVVDWDCHRCKRAVITPDESYPCPHCKSPDGVLPETSHHKLGRTMYENWCANERPIEAPPEYVIGLIERA